MNAAIARYLLVAGSIVLALGACTREPEHAALTVDEYLAQPQVMEKKLQECASNPGETKNDPDCINVKAAAARHSLGSLRDLPPMGLPQPGAPEPQRATGDKQP